MSASNQHSTASTGPLKAGFSDPVFDSQATFRTLLDAMSYPGRIQTLSVMAAAPRPLHEGTALLAQALFDFDTTIWLDATAASDEAPEFLKFHCGCPITSIAGEAQFGIVADPLMLGSFDDFALGEDKYPDRSATLLLQVLSLTDGAETLWSGPGIPSRETVRIAGLPEGFWEHWARNGELYPLGVDLILVSGRDMIGLPRSIQVEG